MRENKKKSNWWPGYKSPLRHEEVQQLVAIAGSRADGRRHDMCRRVSEARPAVVRGTSRRTAGVGREGFGEKRLTLTPFFSNYLGAGGARDLTDIKGGAHLPRGDGMAWWDDGEALRGNGGEVAE